MRITSIDSFHICLPLKRESYNPQSSWTQMESLLVRVKTDEGIEGWGEIFGHAVNPVSRAALHSLIIPFFIGKDPTSLAALMSEAQRKFHGFGRTGPVLYALSGIDIALWDILAKKAGLPLYQLLGGCSRTKIEAYASLFTYHGKPALIEAACGHALERGYRLLKLHETSREAFLAARQAVGKDIDVAMDVNCPWSAEQAVQVARSLRDDNICWLEEPVWPPEDAASLALVRREGVRLSAGENAAGVSGFKDLFDHGAIDIAQPSVTKVGGIGAMRQVIALAGAYGVSVIPHCYYYGPGFLATVHIAAALEIPAPVEVAFIDFEQPLYPLWQQISGGMISLPQAPGLGQEPDPEILKRYAVA